MEPSSPRGPDIPHAGAKAIAVLVASAVIAAAFVVYVLYARGTFERTQSLVLMAEDGAGVSVGMDLTFSGFPVGRVQKIELAADGKARIEVDVPEKDAKWLRASSVFTLEKSLVNQGADIAGPTADGLTALAVLAVAAPGCQVAAVERIQDGIAGLPGHRRPRWVHWLDALPLTATGKLQRGQLRPLHEAALATARQLA